MNSIAVMSIGLIMILGSAWQIYLFKVDVRKMRSARKIRTKGISGERKSEFIERHPREQRDKLLRFIAGPGRLSYIRIFLQHKADLTFGQFYDVLSILPNRLIIPVIFGAVIIFGVPFYSLICLFDSNKGYIVFSTFMLWLFKALVFAVAINGKSYLGPIVVSFCFSWELYYLIEYRELHAVPLLGSLSDWIFSFGPEWASNIYLTLQTIYCIASSGFDTIYQWDQK